LLIHYFALFPLGGLDSTVLAVFADRCLADSDEAIDLLNVAFEQSDGTFDVPDRITALKALTGKELAVHQLLIIILSPISHK
jgi:asparagine synthetase B (glutamine-hydrolysing)